MLTYCNFFFQQLHYIDFILVMETYDDNDDDIE